MNESNCISQTVRLDGRYDWPIIANHILQFDELNLLLNSNVQSYKYLKRYLLHRKMLPFVHKLNKSKVVQRCLYSYRQRYSSSQWSKCCGLTRRSRVSPQQILITVMKNIVVDKSTDNAEPLSICFLPQYSAPKKVSISERDQNHDSKTEQSVVYNFLAI